MVRVEIVDAAIAVVADPAVVASVAAPVVVAVLSATVLLAPAEIVDRVLLVVDSAVDVPLAIAPHAQPEIVDLVRAAVDIVDRAAKDLPAVAILVASRTATASIRFS